MAKVTELPMSGAAPLGSDELVMVQNGEVVRVSLFALSGYLANPVAPPVFTEGPVIITDGTPAVGEEITFDLGTIVGGVVAGADLLRGSAVIVEDVGESYMLAAADEGEQLRVRVRASGPGGNVEAISAPIGPIGEAPSGVLITGTRLAIMGDSRTDNGMISQAGTGTGRTTGVPGSSRLQSIPDWMLRALDYPAEIVGQWTLGGNKSSQNYHDHALRVIAARNPDVVFLLDSTNDPIDYTGTGGLGPIPRGSTNPLLAAYQPRVGDREPVGAGIGIQGTTFGNIDKAIRFWGDGVANGLGRSVPVILVAVPSGQPSRQVLNRLVYEWAQEAKALGIYSNLIAPAVYPLMLVDPDMVNGPVASEVIRSDLKGDGSQGADGETLFLHPAPAEAQFLGEAIAADPQVAAAFAGRPSIQVLPTGANDSAFLNTNPGCLVGSGGGSLGYVGSSSPTPTGLVAPGWSLGHGVTTGTIAVVGSAGANDRQRITVTRTGGSLPDTARTVQLRGTPVTITPVAGDVYVFEAEVTAPSRDPLDLFAVTGFIQVIETGLVDDRGQNIAVNSYGAITSNEPNPFPPTGGTFKIHSVPFEITPAIVASATGTIDLDPRFDIRFSDAMDTATNGALVVEVRGGIRKLTGYSHVSPPAVPSAGPACTTAPRIAGNLFVGSTVTLVDPVFASGSITSRRLLRNGVQVSYTGSTYTLTEADLGAYFCFEVKGGTGAAITTAMSPAAGPVTTPSAELSALVTALSGVAANAIFDNRAAFTGIPTSNDWRVPDYSGNSNTGAQTALTRHPGIDPVLGGTFDGSNDAYGYPWPGGSPPTAVRFVGRLRKTVGASGKRLVSDGTTTAGNTAGSYTSGSTTAVAHPTTVDGVSVATQGALFTALNDGLDHTVVITGITVTGWANMFISRITGAHEGSIVKAVVIDEATANLADATAAAVAYVEAE